MKEKEERKLTRAEEERKAKYLNTKQRMEEKGYQTKELTTDLVSAKVMVAVLEILLLILFNISFFQVHWVNGDVVQGVLDLPGGLLLFWYILSILTRFFTSIYEVLAGVCLGLSFIPSVLTFGLCVILLVVAIFALVTVHKLIPGVTWAIFTPNHFKDITFGMAGQFFKPYCYCKEVLHIWQYILGALMPTIILGIIPCIVAIITGSTFLLVLGCLMILGGGGDLTIVLKMILYRSDKKEKVFLAHPYERGTVVFEK